MAKSQEQPPTCACGQVMFDVGDRKTGDVLTCPWCDRKYQYYGGSHLEPYKEGAPKKEPENKDGDEKRGFFNFGSSAEAPRLDIPKNDKAEKTAKYDKVDKNARNSQRVTTRDKSPGPPGSKPKSRAPAEIPGGLMPMLGFMIGFNVIAFVALHFALPAATDGTRLAPWGDVIPKKAMWPELVTLVVGHIIGFVGWAVYVYKRVKTKQDDAAAAKEAAAPKN